MWHNKELLSATFNPHLSIKVFLTFSDISNKLIVNLGQVITFSGILSC